ncbi:MAG: CPBP family intramembrane glutamic endopeptidase [Phycisphaerales bacterium]
MSSTGSIVGTAAGVGAGIAVAGFAAWLILHAPTAHADGLITLAQQAKPDARNGALDQATAAATKAANDFSKLIKSDPWRYGHIIAASVCVLGLLFADVVRPGSLERAGKRDVSTFGPHIWFLCGVLVTGMQMVAGGFNTMLPEKWLGDADSIQGDAVKSTVIYAVSILTAYLLAKLISASAKGAGLAFTARSTAWGLMAFVLAWPIVQASSFAFLAMNTKFKGPEPGSNIAHDTLAKLVEHKNDPWAWLLAGLAVIAAPVVEEIVYRGFLQSSILRMTEKPWISILVTSALFASVHMVGKHPVPWFAAATVGVLGMCMGIAYERTKEIGVPITMHVLYNLTNVILAMYTSKGA